MWGFLIHHYYKDSYQTTRIQWKVRRFFSVLHLNKRCFFSKIFKIFAGYHPSSYPAYAWQTKNISERSHLTELRANRDEQISNQ